eukprot:4913134-Prymnesium_polylepis.1
MISGTKGLISGEQEPGTKQMPDLYDPNPERLQLADACNTSEIEPLRAVEAWVWTPGWRGREDDSTRLY